jgi:hypothetical protein
MLLDLRDPESILQWWKVLPDQHDSYLNHVFQARPQFRTAIKEAQRRIASDPALRSLLARAVQQRQAGEAFRASREGHVPAHELRWRELAAA